MFWKCGQGSIQVLIDEVTFDRRSSGEFYAVEIQLQCLHNVDRSVTSVLPTPSPSIFISLIIQRT